MPDGNHDDNTSLDRVPSDRSLGRRSGFMARRARELAQKGRELKLGDEIEVVFPDKYLEAAVREELENADGPLTRGDLKRMKDLRVADKEIEDLTGLEHAVNLPRSSSATTRYVMSAPWPLSPTWSGSVSVSAR